MELFRVKDKWRIIKGSGVEIKESIQYDFLCIIMRFKCFNQQNWTIHRVKDKGNGSRVVYGKFQGKG